MYRYIIHDTMSESHFKKTNYPTEMKANLTSETQSDSIQHAYRIEDITKAINTSILLDVEQKNTYNDWLTSDTSHFDASDEFINICREVGECDVY